MAAPGALENDIQRVVEFIEHQRAEPDERQKHSPSNGFQGAHTMQLRDDMFSHRGKEAFEKTEESLLSDHVLTHHKTEAVEQKEDEREEGERSEERRVGKEG